MPEDPEKHICLMLHHVCVTHYGSANQEFVGRQRPHSRRPLTSLPNPSIPLPFSLPPYPLSTLATQAMAQCYLFLVSSLK